MSAPRRGRAPSPEFRCVCGHRLERWWPYCPNCGRAQVWRDDNGVTGAECYRCGWMVSDASSWCPWCEADIYEEGASAVHPLKAPRGFRMDARCDWGCGGGVQYPMPFCPWCGRPQSCNEEDRFEGDRKSVV